MNFFLWESQPRLQFIVRSMPSAVHRIKPAFVKPEGVLLCACAAGIRAYRRLMLKAGNMTDAWRPYIPAGLPVD